MARLLEEVDGLAFGDAHEGPLAVRPHRRPARRDAPHPGLALPDERADVEHLHAEEPLDGLADLDLVRERIDLEAVGVPPLRGVHRLLRHDRPAEDVVRVAAHRRPSPALPAAAVRASRAPSTRT